MKMVMAVVPRDEAEGVLSALIAAGHTATFTESRGGMLRQAQYTLFIGVDEQALPHVLDIIHGSCHSDVRVERGEGEMGAPTLIRPTAASASVGGAAVFVWDLEQFTTY
jgi:uncharacterized protein YaaQ